MIDIKRFRKDQNIPQSEIINILGVSQPYVSAVENGKRPLSKEGLEKLHNHYGDVILEYKLPDVTILVKGDEGYNTDIIYVPLLPISAQGGSLNDFVVSVKDSDCEMVVSPIKGADFAMTVSGDSMAPEYPAGSQILIKKIDENIFIDWGKVYVLDTRNGSVVKTLVPSDKEGYVRCLSINDDPKYAPFDVPISEVFGFYRVMLCMSVK